jgi:large repetitive protein
MSSQTLTGGIMHDAPRHIVRLIASLALVCATPAAVAMVATPAGAACPSTGCTGPTMYTYSSTLTVTKSTGTVKSNDAGPTINCGSICSVTDTQVTDSTIRPTTWPTYTLLATGGPSGYSPKWAGCDTSGVSCVIENDQQDGHTVSLSWTDTTPPSLTFAPPSKVGWSTPISASATDNSGSAIDYQWKVDNEAVPTPFSDNYIELDSAAEGEHQIEVQAIDAAGNISSKTATVLFDKHTDLTSTSQLPAFTNGPVTLTFAHDSDATVRCGFYGSGTSHACTTDTSYTEPFTGLPDGNYTLEVSATDDVGNTAGLFRMLTLDRTTPVVAITGGPAEGSRISSSTVDFAFSITDTNAGTAVCAMDGAPLACTHQAHATGLMPGAHTLTVTATDLAGNATTLTRTFTRNKITTPVQAHPKRARTHRGHPVTLIANHLPGNATGKVVFKKKAKTLCTARVRDGVAKCQTSRHLKRGLYRVKATYLGSTVYAASSNRTSFRIV